MKKENSPETEMFAKLMFCGEFRIWSVECRFRSGPVYCISTPTISSTVYDLPGITEYEPAGGVCEHHPGGDVTGRLSPRVSDEPEVGHHHREPHQGVETEDHRHALPVGEEGPALRHLLVLRLLVVDHADDHQEEAGRHLDKMTRVMTSSLLLFLTS